MNRVKKEYWLLSALLVAKVLLQIWATGTGYELHRDEFLHLDQGHHLAWGYASVPPFTSWTSWIIIQLGNSEFWVKFFPALWGVLTIVVVWRMAGLLGGSLLAKTLAGVAVLFSSLVRLNLLYQPNSFDILSWSALIFFLSAYLQKKQVRWLYFAAVIFALGFLNKYNIAILAAAIAPALLLTPQRSIFREKHLYVAASVALLLILPNLLWQWQHDFPVATHMKELAGTQLIHVNRADFLIDQLLYFPGALFLSIGSLLALLLYPPFRNIRFLFPVFFLVILLFLYFKAKSYYAIGLYPCYIAIGAVYLDEVWSHGWKRFLKIALFLLPILLFIPGAKVAYPTQSPAFIASHPDIYGQYGLLRWEDGQDHSIPQDFADMLGWKEMAHKTDSTLETVGDWQNTIVIADNYGQAGAFNFYTTLPTRAHSFNADYINWLQLDREYKNVILIKEAGDSSYQDLFPAFEHAYVADSITSPYARERGARIVVLQGARRSITDQLRKLRQERLATGSK